MKSHRVLLFSFVLILAGTYYLFYDGPDHLASRSIKELWNLGHIGYFALLVFLLSHFNSLKKIALPYQWMIYLLLGAVLGTLIEILQYGTAREPDIADIFRDLTGCLLILSFYPPFLQLGSKVGKLSIRLFASAVLCFQLIPLTVAVIDEATAYVQFPVLSNFDTPFELERWDGGAAKEIVQLDPETATHQLKIDLTTSTYSGVGMKYLPPDWRGYKQVHLRIYKPSAESLSIVIRIHDRAHTQGAYAYAHRDRYNKRLSLEPGWNELVIPLSSVESAPYKRKMDMSQIVDISLFVTRQPKNRVIYLDSVYLAR